jgi:hypothetical protein
MSTTHRMTTTAAVILSLAAAGAPTSIARPVGADTATAANQAPGSSTRLSCRSPRACAAPATVYSRPDKSLIRVTTPSGDSTGRPAGGPQAVVQVQTPPSGFDWGDAGIGAAGGVALAMLGLGGALVITHRPKRTRHNTGLPS